MGIDSVSYLPSTKTSLAICVVTELSDALKKLIRKELSRVCHGTAKAREGKNIYAYHNTLKEFIKRYKNKTKKTQVGMIGELLCHILLFHYNKQLKPASPLFNMEEGSIKKGFDLIALNKKNQTFWLTEVKSGEADPKGVHGKAKSLIQLAKRDLEQRIPKKEATIWYSAINNVALALEEKSNEKKILIHFLEEFLEAQEADIDKLPDSRVILVPVVFSHASTPLEIDVLQEEISALLAEPHFAECMIFAIQKSTVKKVEEFLFSEASATS